MELREIVNEIKTERDLVDFLGGLKSAELDLVLSSWRDQRCKLIASEKGSSTLQAHLDGFVLPHLADLVKEFKGRNTLWKYYASQRMELYPRQHPDW